MFRPVHALLLSCLALASFTGAALATQASSDKSDDAAKKAAALAKAIVACDQGAAVPLDPQAKAPPIQYVELFPQDFDLSKLKVLADECQVAMLGAPQEKRLALQWLRVQVALNQPGLTFLLPQIKLFADRGSPEANYLLYEFYSVHRHDSADAGPSPITRDMALDALQKAGRAGHLTALMTLLQQYGRGALLRRDPHKLVETAQHVIDAPAQGSSPGEWDSQFRKAMPLLIAQTTLENDGFSGEEQQKAFQAVDADSKAGTSGPEPSVLAYIKALRLGDLLKARRKPILMAAAAIMLALAGLQLGKAFLSTPERSAVNETPPASVQTAVAAPLASAAEEKEAVAPAPVRMAAQNEAAKVPTPEIAGATPGAGATVEAAVARPAGPDRPVANPQSDIAAPVAAHAQTPDQATGTDASHVQIANPDADATNDAVAPAAAQNIDVPAEIEPAALREAAGGGDAKALFEIGSRYAEARGVKEDMATAAKWYEKAAAQGLAPAEYRIGNFYEKGIGVARDIGKAKTWYQRAAEQGNASAMHNLAVLYAMAADGTADNQTAARWFQQAADLGVKDSQFNLGILAAKGAGMPQNLEESYKWFALVAKTGDKDAAAKRDEIAKALRPEQLERARATTELWKAKPLDQAANSVDIPPAWEDAPATTASIDMKKAVQNIQRILNKNGYDAGGTDGVMGDKTKKAIMAFQTDNGLSATGEVDDKLVKALLARK